MHGPPSPHCVLMQTNNRLEYKYWIPPSYEKSSLKNLRNALHKVQKKKDIDGERTAS